VTVLVYVSCVTGCVLCVVSLDMSVKYSFSLISGERERERVCVLLIVYVWVCVCVFFFRNILRGFLALR
jgi:hypothetical protein